MVVALRPGRAWSVGLITLATLWALLAVAIKQLGWPVKVNQLHTSSNLPVSLSSIDWLNVGAIGTGLVSMLGIVRLTDNLALFSQLAWQLPILCAAICWSWRSTNAREFVLLSGIGWCLATWYSIGKARHWWDEQLLVLSIASHVAIACAICLVLV